MYRPHSGDCSNNGLSSSYNRVFLINEEGNLNFNVLDDDCPLNIVKDALVKDSYGNVVYKATPLFSSTPGVWCMFGGTFVYTCDSRYRTEYEYPIPLHDRIER